MSIGITILTGSNSPVMTEQVKIYLCVGYTEKEESCLCATKIDWKFQDEPHC